MCVCLKWNLKEWNLITASSRENFCAKFILWMLAASWIFFFLVFILLPTAEVLMWINRLDLRKWIFLKWTLYFGLSMDSLDLIKKLDWNSKRHQDFQSSIELEKTFLNFDNISVWIQPPKDITKLISLASGVLYGPCWTPGPHL